MDKYYFMADLMLMPLVGNLGCSKPVNADLFFDFRVLFTFFVENMLDYVTNNQCFNSLSGDCFAYI